MTADPGPDWERRFVCTADTADEMRRVALRLNYNRRTTTVVLLSVLGIVVCWIWARVVLPLPILTLLVAVLGPLSRVRRIGRLARKMMAPGVEYAARSDERQIVIHSPIDETVVPFVAVTRFRRVESMAAFWIRGNHTVRVVPGALFSAADEERIRAAIGAR